MLKCQKHQKSEFDARILVFDPYSLALTVFASLKNVEWSVFYLFSLSNCVIVRFHAISSFSAIPWYHYSITIHFTHSCTFNTHYNMHTRIITQKHLTLTWWPFTTPRTLNINLMSSPKITNLLLLRYTYYITHSTTTTPDRLMEQRCRGCRRFLRWRWVVSPVAYR